MTLLQLRLLLAVADHGGFTAAAERMGMSQPAVSRSIAALERELGTALMIRHRDGVTLTEAGARAVAHADEALRHTDLLRAEVAAVSGQVTGTLRLASLPTATGTLVASHLRTFTERYPQVRVRLLEGSDQEVRDWLDQGAADVGVVTLPAPGLQTVPLDSHDMVAVLPADHRLANRAAITFRALEDESFILSTGGCAQVFMAAAREAGVRFTIAFEAREMSAVLEMVAAGLGISILPSLGLPTDLGTAVTRPLEPRTTRTLAIAISATAASIPAPKAFIDHLTKTTTGTTENRDQTDANPSRASHKAKHSPKMTNKAPASTERPRHPKAKATPERNPETEPSQKRRATPGTKNPRPKTNPRYEGQRPSGGVGA
jgi:DNA-binding transcriptional LysR family regulator